MMAFGHGERMAWFGAKSNRMFFVNFEQQT
jgi:hypothetical protein